MRDPPHRTQMTNPTSDVPYGTLDLLVLRTLDTLGPLHGFGLARRIEQVSENLVTLNQGSIYPALLRLQQQGWIKAKWSVSETNRRAKYYAVPKAGRKQIQTEVANWERTTALVALFLAMEPQ